MPAKPIPGLGLVIGVIVGYAAMLGSSYAMSKLGATRAATLDGSLDRTLPWVGLLLAVAVVASVLMAVPTIGAGVMTGAGAFMTLFGLIFLLAPLRTTFDLVKLFRVPGERLASYTLLDGSFVLLGVIILIVGARRWASDTKVHQLLSAQGQAQDRAYRPGFPAQPGQQPGQPQQWGGYPGQPQHPGQQPQHPGQQPQYPGQQPQHGAHPGQQTFPNQPGAYPGQQPPQDYRQQPPHPGQQPPR